MSARISLRGLRRLIWVDTLRSVHNGGFLVERLKCQYCWTVRNLNQIHINSWTLSLIMFLTYYACSKFESFSYFHAFYFLFQYIKHCWCVSHEYPIPFDYMWCIEHLLCIRTILSHILRIYLQADESSLTTW